jgi:hypothetical protein
MKNGKNSLLFGEHNAVHPEPLVLIIRSQFEEYKLAFFGCLSEVESPLKSLIKRCKM